jgi:pyrroloquinoline quinone biosynthesis protein D
MTATLHATSRPRLAPGVRLRHDKVRDAWVLLAPESLIEANAVAVEVLRRCTGALTLDELVDDLATAFTADRAVIDADVRPLLAELAEKRLVDL